MHFDDDGRCRRTLLCGLTSALSAGCVGWPSDAFGSRPTVTDTPRRETTSQQDAENFYIENVYSESTELSLKISRDSSVLVEDEFEIPGSTGVVFRDIGTVGSTYSVSAATIGGDLGVTAQWDVHSCADSEAPKGNTDGGVRFSGEDLLFRQNACDAIFIGTRRFTYGDPDAYRI